MEPGDLTGAILDGRYRVIEPVAEGAMGVVYRAERIKLGRIVAVKVLHESLPNELSSRKRFEIEAMAMAKLEHPHCAAVLDVGMHDDRPFVVMDFVSGPNLKDVIASQAPLPVARAAEIVRQILSGLAHAHEHEIIHRDIKPANIVLSQKSGLGDHVKILDFGLARLSQDSSLTTGIVVGTPSYMAPEQIRGTLIDGRVDLYACGVLLFELLTGRKPFVSKKDDPIEVCSMHLKNPPPRLADLRAGVDFGELEAVVARALAKKADERFATAGEFAGALEAAALRHKGASIAPPIAQPVAPPVAPPIAPPVAQPAVDANLRATLPGLSAVPSGVQTRSGPTGQSAGAPIAPPPNSTLPGLAAIPPAPGPEPTMASLGFSPPPPRVAPPPPSAHGAPSAPPPTSSAAAPTPLWRNRKYVAIGASALLAVLVLAVVLATSGSSSTTPPVDAAVAPAPAPTPAPADPAADVLARADELISAGRREAALDLLTGSRRAFPEDARLSYLAGKLYFERLWWTDGLKQLRDTVRLDPQYRTDPELIKIVLKGFITTPRYDSALASFLREEIGPAAKPYLEETATSHPNASIRQRAASELRRYP
ncbi:MAG: protein kinase domain-containing protein [Kofleriaceae bacterium]